MSGSSTGMQTYRSARAAGRVAAMLALVAPVALSVASSTPLGAQAPAIDRPRSAADAADRTEGQRLYNAQCALCHGVDGNGGYGPSLLRPTFVRPPTTLA
ncbi:MAG TPA: c-type cytochrome [Vicinamibacterales bacterium]|nr:c-type cytochrome [Vicinamibacterales bacterium]